MVSNKFWVHVSPMENENSILSDGLIPSVPYFEHHLKIFKEDLKSDRVIYLSEIGDYDKRTKKLIKDSIYAKMFIVPNHKRFENKENSRFYLPHKLEEEKRFCIFLIEIRDLSFERQLCIHQQSRHNMYKSNHWENIDRRYLHRKKKILVTPESIPSSWISKIGEVICFKNFDMRIEKMDWKRVRKARDKK